MLLLMANAAPAPMRDCSDCPAMLPIPGGTIVVGAPPDDSEARADERPLSPPIQIRRFAMGRDPVTRDEFAIFVRETGRVFPRGCAYSGRSWSKMDDVSTWSDLGFAQAGNHPVVCVTWDDATAYAAWLSRRTGKRYRLPTEAEWEYAARAGTVGPYYGSTTIGHDRANLGAPQCCKPRAEGADQWDYTAPVDAFPANPWGLRDMAGNALEWVADCYRPGYRDQPRDGSAFATDISFDAGRGRTLRSCDHRGLRGGDWGNPPAFLRVTARNYGPAPGYTLSEYRSGGVGFRVARDR